MSATADGVSEQWRASGLRLRCPVQSQMCRVGAGEAKLIAVPGGMNAPCAAEDACFGLRTHDATAVELRICW